MLLPHRGCAVTLPPPTHRPELLLLRIKELCTKVAGVPRPGRNDRDRRYYTFIGEALTLYFEPSLPSITARSATWAGQHGYGKPEDARGRA